MTMTVFILMRKMTDDVQEQQLDVQEISIRDPDADEQIPVAEADDEDGDEEWPGEEDEPDHYDWKEVYELNGCDSQYL